MIYIQDSDYETAKENGICASTLYARVHSYHMPIEEAIVKPLQGRDPERLRWKQIAEQNGIDRHLFNSRLAEKWSYERAATEKKNTREEIARRTAKSNLKTFTPEQVELMKENGIKHSTAYGRVYNHDWDPQDAVTAPVGSRNPNPRKKYKPMLAW